MYVFMLAEKLEVRERRTGSRSHPRADENRHP